MKVWDRGKGQTLGKTLYLGFQSVSDGRTGRHEQGEATSGLAKKEVEGGGIGSREKNGDGALLVRDSEERRPTGSGRK